jgi:cytochrome c-type protein NapC
MNDPQPRPSSQWERLRSRLFAPPRSKWLFGIPVGALLCFGLGLIVYGGAGAVLHATGSTKFCATACHSQAAFSTPSWKESPHFKNAKGVGAGCPDCHIPRPLVPMLIRKMQSVKEVWGEMTGVISTQEKFDAKKLEMARHVWAYMKATDSRECRFCHNTAAWDLSAQGDMARRKHEKLSAGATCIDCHQGVAHEVPPDAG